jgi:hypothetical protein
MTTTDQQLQQPGESSIAYIERRMAHRLEDARRRYLSSASQHTMQLLSPTSQRNAGGPGVLHDGVGEAAQQKRDDVRSSSILSTLSSSSSMYLQRPAEQSLRDLHRSSTEVAVDALRFQANPVRTSPTSTRSPRLAKPGLVHSSLWFHSNENHGLLLHPQTSETSRSQRGPVSNNRVVPSSSSPSWPNIESQTKHRAVDEASILTTQRELLFPDPSPVREAPILSSSSSSSDDGGNVNTVNPKSRTAPGMKRSPPSRSASPRRHVGRHAGPDLVEMIIGSHTKAQQGDAPHYQHDEHSHRQDEEDEDNFGERDTSTTTVEKLPFRSQRRSAYPQPPQLQTELARRFHPHHHQQPRDADPRRHHDEPSTRSFWITVWPAYFRSGLPQRICVSPRSTYFQTVLERAAAAARCTPAPTVLYTPAGLTVYDLDGLVANGHYLIAPSAVKYHVDMVPTALLRELVKAAEAAVEGR